MSTAIAGATTATAAPSSAQTRAEPQPDFIKHPPLHLKPPCKSTADAGGRGCIVVTLQCDPLDPGETAWVAVTPAIAKLEPPDGAKGLRVTRDNELAARVCCTAAGADAAAATAQVRLFTNEVAGSTHPLDCR